MAACSAIHWSFVDTVCELKVSPVFPSSETSCPASPSLPWVPWTSVPHVPDLEATTPLPPGHRYYAPLRLPIAPPGSLRSSLAPRYLARFPLFVSRLSSGSLTAGKLAVNARALGQPVPLLFRPFTARKHWALPSPRATPVSTCPALRPRWRPPHSPFREPGLLPSAHSKASAFLPLGRGNLSFSTTTIHISGLNHAACTLATPGTEHPIAGMHAGSLRTCWLGFGPVGLASPLPVGLTDWVTSTSFRTSLLHPLASGFVLARGALGYARFSSVKPFFK